MRKKNVPSKDSVQLFSSIPRNTSVSWGLLFIRLSWNRPLLLLCFLLCLISCTSFSIPLWMIMCPEMLEYSKLWIFQHHVTHSAICREVNDDLKTQNSRKWGTSDKTLKCECWLCGTPVQVLWKHRPPNFQKLSFCAVSMLVSRIRQTLWKSLYCPVF